jgi:hypothetical protein
MDLEVDPVNGYEVTEALGEAFGADEGGIRHGVTLMGSYDN